MISYRLGDVDGMWVASLLIEIPFTTLIEGSSQVKKGLSFHLQRTGLHANHRVYDSNVWICSH
jgi:hypothetical protein